MYYFSIKYIFLENSFSNEILFYFINLSLKFSIYIYIGTVAGTAMRLYSLQHILITGLYLSTRQVFRQTLLNIPPKRWFTENGNSFNMRTCLLELARMNKTEMSKVGAISQAQKAQSF